MKPVDINISISDYDYPLPEQRIARFPLERREMSKLLVSDRGTLSHTGFGSVGDYIPEGSLLVFNNTKVIRARLIMHKPSGARIEVFCLEPHDPADYERAFAVCGECVWRCIVGNSKKWKEGPLEIPFGYGGDEYRLSAYRAGTDEHGQLVRFVWDAPLTFGQLLEHLGRIPIPPYLGRGSQEIDNTRYQTVYSKFEGSVAAPTAGLHFTDEIIDTLRGRGVQTAEVTLHVGAGTFLPVKEDDVAAHQMHTEHFEVSTELLRSLLAHEGSVVAVGTTTVRTLESLYQMGSTLVTTGRLDPSEPVGQWQPYGHTEEVSPRQALESLLGYMDENHLAKLKTSTRIIIVPGYRFRIVDRIITNFHQPKSTLLLLVSAFVGDHWRQIYDYALCHDFRFLSYGDSSILIR